MAWIDVLNAIGRNADMNNSEMGVADTLFRGGNYDRLVQKYLKDSGAYQSMSPYYYQALVKNAKRLAMQSILEDVANGASAEESVSSENFGKHLEDLMKTEGGLGWKRSSETRPMFAQALANIASWGSQPEGSQARAIYDYIMTDPDMLKALGLVAIGPGYGGAFNQAYTDAYSNWLDNQAIWAGTDNPAAQTNFWNTLGGIFGGIGGASMPAPKLGTPNTAVGKTGGMFYTPPTVASGAGGAPATPQAGGGPAIAAGGGNPPSPNYESSGQGTVVNTPEEAAALANGAGNGPNYEGVEIAIPPNSGIMYKYTKGPDGKWKVVPSNQYTPPTAAPAGAAAKPPPAPQVAGPQPAPAPAAMNPYFDNGIQSPAGPGPSALTTGPEPYIPPAEGDTPQPTLTAQDRSLAQAFPTLFAMWRRSGSTQTFSQWFAENYKGAQYKNPEVPQYRPPRGQ